MRDFVCIFSVLYTLLLKRSTITVRCHFSIFCSTQDTESNYVTLPKIRYYVTPPEVRLGPSNDSTPLPRLSDPSGVTISEYCVAISPLFVYLPEETYSLLPREFISRHMTTHVPYPPTSTPLMDFGPFLDALS